MRERKRRGSERKRGERKRKRRRKGLAVTDLFQMRLQSVLILWKTRTEIKN